MTGYEHVSASAPSVNTTRPKVTLCLLTYGDHASLARQALESIRRHYPRSEYHLIVGANAVCNETLSYLETRHAAGDLDHLIHSAENINKCPMMRRMFERVETEFIWWFDDDSYVTAPGTLAQWLQAACAAPASTVMWGEVNRCQWKSDFTDMEDVESFVRSATWYRGLPPPSWRPGGKGEFNFQNRNCGTVAGISSWAAAGSSALRPLARWTGRIDGSSNWATTCFSAKRSASRAGSWETLAGPASPSTPKSAGEIPAPALVRMNRRTASRPDSQRVSRGKLPGTFAPCCRFEPLRPETGRGPGLR
jgi:hypothetical protein